MPSYTWKINLIQRTSAKTQTAWCKKFLIEVFTFRNSAVMSKISVLFAHMIVTKFFAMLDVSCVPPRRGGDGDGVQASSRPVVSRESEDA